MILVDDGSTDGTSELVQVSYPWVTYLRGTGNLWWTGAVNFGLASVLNRADKEDFVLIINDDVEFSSNYFTSLLVHSGSDKIVGSIVVDINNPTVINDGGRRINWWTAKKEFLNKGCEISSFPDSHYEKVSTLTGRGTLFPVIVFTKVGLYDQHHFRHRGDTELPVRAKKAGYSLIVSYSSIVKSHVENTFALDVAKKLSLKDVYFFFFDFRSSGQIMFRLNFAFFTRRNFLQFLSYFLLDMARVLLNFLKRLSG